MTDRGSRVTNDCTVIITISAGRLLTPWPPAALYVDLVSDYNQSQQQFIVSATFKTP